MLRRVSSVTSVLTHSAFATSVAGSPPYACSTWLRRHLSSLSAATGPDASRFQRLFGFLTRGRACFSTNADEVAGSTWLVRPSQRLVKNRKPVTWTPSQEDVDARLAFLCETMGMTEDQAWKELSRPSERSGPPNLLFLWHPFAHCQDLSLLQAQYNAWVSAGAERDRETKSGNDPGSVSEELGAESRGVAQAQGRRDFTAHMVALAREVPGLVFAPTLEVTLRRAKTTLTFLDRIGYEGTRRMFRLSPRMVLLLPEAVADRMAQCTHALSRVGLSQPRSMHFIARSPNLITFVKLENRVEEYMEFLQGIGLPQAAARGELANNPELMRYNLWRTIVPRFRLLLTLGVPLASIAESPAALGGQCTVRPGSAGREKMLMLLSMGLPPSEWTLFMLKRSVRVLARLALVPKDSLNRTIRTRKLDTPLKLTDRQFASTRAAAAAGVGSLALLEARTKEVLQSWGAPGGGRDQAESAYGAWLDAACAALEGEREGADGADVADASRRWFWEEWRPALERQRQERIDRAFILSTSAVAYAREEEGTDRVVAPRHSYGLHALR